MSGLYTEENLVQRTAAEFLEKELGWEAVYAMHETLGPEGTLGRGDEGEVVLARELLPMLRKLNPGLPESVYGDAVRQIAESSVGQGLDATNREKHALLVDGVAVSFRNGQGEREKRRLRVFDFERPGENRFLCVREFWVKGALYRRRADLVGFVNGIPLVFMECKNVCKNVRVAYEKNLRDYKETVPGLFFHNALCILANGTDALVGAHSSPFKHFHAWKRLEEEAPGAVEMETLLRGVCDKRNLLDLLENFILFDESAGAPRKILALNHQFLGVNRAVEAVRRRGELEGKLGVFWHTQGSGKSYSMAFFARKVLRKVGGNFTFLVLTDREELDRQIYNTFAGCGLADNEREPCRAGSGASLRKLLRGRGAFVFSLIQKFGDGEGCFAGAVSLRDDIIVVSDEAHRTQYGALAANLRRALPNASRIGFTGTPLFKEDELTKQVFGDYVSTYDFQRAVEDGATVPLFYDARGEMLRVSVGDINERIARVLAEAELDDLDERLRLEDDLKRDCHVITAQKRLEAVARDFVGHYSASWQSGKAMLVCIDKVTCARMHALIVRYWQEKTAELEEERLRLGDPAEIAEISKRIAWMRETVAAVVVSEEQGEAALFAKWGIDITPHRRLLKKGIGIPEALRGRPEYQGRRHMPLEDAFREPEHPFRIAIVCAMWLTGFDVPCLANLYLDRPLKAHTLMQAIARANRVREGKENGLIVDYCGILRYLREALATFAGFHDGGAGHGGGRGPLHPAGELLASLDEALELVKAFLREKGAPLEDILGKQGFKLNAAILAAKEAANENDETRRRFEIMCRMVFAKYRACLTLEGVEARRPAVEAVDILYRSLREGVWHADNTDLMRTLQGIVDKAIAVERPAGNRAAEAANSVYDLSKIDFDRLRQEFARKPGRRTTFRAMKEVVEDRLRRMLARNPGRTDFQARFEQIVTEYNSEKNHVTIERTFEELLRFAQSLEDEEQRAAREGLDEESLAVYDLLFKPELTPAEIKRIKGVARSLLDALKAEKLRIDHWREKEQSRDAVRSFIHDFLWDDRTGLPSPAYDEQEVVERTRSVFRHIFQAYPTVPSPFYESAAS